MKMTKRIFSLVLCLTLMLALALPAMAAGEDGYTLTINNATDGHTYEAYQIFSGSLVEKDGKQILSDIEWGTGVNGDDLLAAVKLVNGLSVLHTATDAASLADKLADVTSDSVTLDLFAEVVGQHLNAVAGSSTDAGDHYEITGLAAGYYLIKDQDNSLVGTNHDVYTKYIIRVLKDESVTPKGDVPKVDKTINDTIDGTFTNIEDFDINDTAYYKWEGTLPSNLSAYDNYFYKFIDTLPDGIVFNRIEQVYIEGHDGNLVHTFYDVTKNTITGGKLAVVTEKDENGNDVEIASVTLATSGNNVTVTFSDLLKLYPNLLATQKIIVKYSARVTRDALIAEPMTNSVKVEYSNNPNGSGNGNTGTTPEDEAYAFTFAITVDKYDADDKEIKLAGAEFVLYYERTEKVDGVDTTVKHYAQVITEEMIDAGTVINGTAVDEDDLGVVYGWVTDKAQASILDTDSSGALTVNGLDEGLYYLEETKAPAGYNLMETPVQIKITPTYTETADSASVTVSYEVDSIAQTSNKVGVRNSAGSTLPVTGGVGTTMFYVVGAVLVAAAVIMLIYKRRVEE